MISSIYNDSFNSELFKIPQVNLPNVGTTNSIYDVGSGNNISPNLATSPFSFQFSPFVGDFSMYMNNDFASTMLLFNAYMSQTLPPSWDTGLFDKSYNVKPSRIKIQAEKPPERRSFAFKPQVRQLELKELKDVYNPKLSNALANIAEKNANAMRKSKDSDRYLCSMGVRQTLEQAGLANGFRAASAYQGADLLRNNKNFKEIDVDKGDLKSLPAGCVIVWDPYYDSKGKSHEDGHIATTLGNGMEASDRVNEMSLRNSKYSVFIPTGIKSNA